MIRSPQNMAGYWKQPDETARTIDADGWLRTGDAGYLDADGYVYIHDRVKDMIISGGENVYPAEVESAIYGHPQVADVAVIGVPDEKWGGGQGHRGAASRVEPDRDAIIAWARQRAGFKIPKTIEFVDALPRNPSGKLLRRKLREPLLGRAVTACQLRRDPKVGAAPCLPACGACLVFRRCWFARQRPVSTPLRGADLLSLSRCIDRGHR